MAKRAGVAKGTIYLYFRDKESLFQELVRAMLTPLVGTIEALGRTPTCRSRVLADRIVDLFVREVFETRRKDVIRLIITEGPRFPKLAEFYYREVLSRIIAAMRALLRARRRARRAARRRWSISRNSRRARPGRHHLERPVRPLRAARRARADAGPSRSAVRRGERHENESVPHCLRWCSPGSRLPAAASSNDREFQGWVEADLIFVSPTSRAGSRR